MDDHLEKISNWLLSVRRGLSTGHIYIILENREQDPTPPTSLQALVKQATEIVSVLAGPGKAKLIANAVVLGIKKLYSPYTDFTRGFYLDALLGNPKPYHGVRDYVKLDILRNEPNLPILLPNRTAGPLLTDVLREKLQLQAYGPEKTLAIDRNTGHEKRQQVYDMGIAPLFEIVEETVTELSGRELRRTVILRRKS